MFLGLGTPFFQNSIYTLLHPISLDGEFLNPLIKNIPFFVTIFGFLCSFFFIYGWSFSKFLIFKFKMSFFIRNIYCFLSKKWHFDQIMNNYLIHSGMVFGYNISFQLLDKGNIEQFGSFGSSKIFRLFSNIFTWFHSGYLYHYMLVFIIFLISLLSFSLLHFTNLFIFDIIFYNLIFSYIFFFIFSKKGV